MSFLNALYEATSAFHKFLVKALWPVQVGSLLVVLGFIASVISNIFSIPDSDLGGIGTPKSQLYSLMQACYAALSLILLGMSINAARTMILWSQRSQIKAGTLGRFDRFSNVFFDIFCMLPSLFVFLISIRAARDLNIFLRRRLSIPETPRSHSDTLELLWKFSQYYLVGPIERHWILGPAIVFGLVYMYIVIRLTRRVSHATP